MKKKIIKKRPNTVVTNMGVKSGGGSGGGGGGGVGYGGWEGCLSWETLGVLAIFYCWQQDFTIINEIEGWVPV